MKLAELVQTIMEKPKKSPYTMALEGVIGSGKSYEAEKLKDGLGERSLLLSTDLFVKVGRNEWTDRIQKAEIDLRQWYDLPKIREALESINRQEKFTIAGLYDLANGTFDRQQEVDASNCDYMILEGLFSCDEFLDGLIDLRIFLDISIDTAMARAHSRDETVRHLDHQGWLLKKQIFFDHYLPYMNRHKNRAELLLDPD